MIDLVRILWSSECGKSLGQCVGWKEWFWFFHVWYSVLMFIVCEFQHYSWILDLDVPFSFAFYLHFVGCWSVNLQLSLCKMFSLIEYSKRLKNGSTSWSSYHWHLCWFGTWYFHCGPGILCHKMVQKECLSSAKYKWAQFRNYSDSDKWIGCKYWI